jgi:signal transduction histidine kinase
MERTASVFVKASVAGVGVVLILAVGMGFAIRSFARLASAQMAHVHVEEAEINTAARLRWSGELLVSVGRGYLLSGNPDLLAKLRTTETSFDHDLVELRTGALTPTMTDLVAEVERTAERFRRVQRELVDDRGRSTIEDVIRRFEGELLALQREVERSLNRLLVRKEAAIQDVYKHAELNRGRMVRQMYGLLSVLTLVGLAVTWLSARRLHQSHRTEEQALKRARRALAARDELMGVVAHDLRTPLAAITAKAALLRREAPSEDSRKQARSIENVAIRMEFLIKSLLDMAAMDGDRLSIAPELFDVDGVVHDTVDMFDGPADSKQIRLEHADADPGLTVHGDRERVLQVLVNLVGNALKFTPRGGIVRLAVEHNDGKALFSVSDSGPGVSRESAPHVFERLWKDDRGGQGGTGLGLFIAKGIVEAHGGRIWVESEPPHGATFYFTLPVGESRRPTPRSPVAEEGAARA